MVRVYKVTFLLFQSIFDIPADSFQIPVTEDGNERRQTLGCKIPPAQTEQEPDQPVVKSLFQHLHGIAAGHCVRRYILCHDRIGRDDRAVAARNAGQDNAFPSDPNIVPDHRVALAGKLLGMGRNTAKG